ncbi:MAG TPA: alpha/beta hydrolase [Acidimicrobiales bacterium]|nr:alpha/beta hydrolase [Acidimicrobiales bacterium]
MDLAAARDDGDEGRVQVLEALIASGGGILVYRPQLQHYALLFGDIETAEHVAVIVPGVGDGTNLCDDWIPDAQTLFEKAPDTAVVLWKGYDNPVDIMAAAAGSIECSEELVTAASDLTAFIESLDLEPEQSLTVVAHSFGSIVTGAALADCGLLVTDVIVVGSPGMTVDELRELHVEQSHFFSEQAPGDAIAELGVFGSSPSSPTFGGTRMSVNAPDRPHVESHSGYFTPESEALENIADVVTGHYEEVRRHRPSFPEIAGGLVSWALRIPSVPLCTVSRRYRGPGFRIMTNWCRLVDFGANETGNAVMEVLDESERALFWVAHRIGALPDLEFSFDVEEERVDPHARREARWGPEPQAE